MIHAMAALGMVRVDGYAPVLVSSLVPAFELNLFSGTNDARIGEVLMKSNQRPSSPDQPTHGRSRFGRAVSDVWASLGGRSSQERAAQEAAASEREAQVQLDRAREILQQDRAMGRSETRPDGDATDQVPEQTGTRQSMPSQFVLDVGAWIVEAIADVAEDGGTPVSITAETVSDTAATTDLAPAALTLALATTELSPTKAPEKTVTCSEPIRTRTMARLLGKQGYRDRALSIYDFLLSATPEDASLRAEAAILRSNELPGPATSGA